MSVFRFAMSEPLIAMSLLVVAWGLGYWAGAGRARRLVRRARESLDESRAALQIALDSNAAAERHREEAVRLHRSVELMLEEDSDG